MATLDIFLSSQEAATHWGKHATLSFDAAGATIHLGTTTSLNTIQTAARKLDGLCQSVSLKGDWTLEQQWAFAMGFDNAKKTSPGQWCDNADKPSLVQLFSAYQFTRDLVNGSPEDIYPQSLCDKVQTWLTSLAGDQITARRWVGEQLNEAGWVGIYHVSRGSNRPGVLLELDYNPTGNDNAPVAAALVGKGITYDSGGYSIKPNESQSFMKCDMAGAATVAGALGLAIQQGLNKRVKLYLCCAENLISGHAYKLGDILSYKNGVQAEILNTDAEGRLVLADGLIAASESGASVIIDAATLTGAAIAALGKDYNALFSMDSEWQSRALELAKHCNEPAWPLPLEPFHRDKCPSPYADTANSRAQKGGGEGGASNAAGFLSRFVREDGKGWLHFDIASAFYNASTSKRAAGGTAIGFRTIAAILHNT